MEKRNKILTTINHSTIEIEGDKAFNTLADFLRKDFGLTGTKVVCAEGDCGACTVLLGRDIGPDGKLQFKAVNSCIIPLYLTDGAQVITVEGIKEENKLHEIQSCMIESNGAQCGYCTPGFICSMAALYEKNKSENKTITEKKARNFLTGNLCRCTGYKGILDAAVKLDFKNSKLLKDRYFDPEWIKKISEIKSHSLLMNFTAGDIFLPVTLKEALEFKSKNSAVKIVGGSTDIGVLVNKGKLKAINAMALYHIDELKKINLGNDEFGEWIEVGATATLANLEEFLEHNIPELKKMLHIFASPQIKNQATLVGNVVNASPIADTIPYLVMSDSIIVMQSLNGTREVKLKDFFIGYKKIDLKENEIVTKIKIRKPTKEEKIKIYKVSLRKDLDISAVTFSGMVVVKNSKIERASFSLGGVGPVVVRLKDIEDEIKDKNFVKETFLECGRKLPLYITPQTDLRASKEYRMLVSKNLFLKFYDEISGEI